MLQTHSGSQHPHKRVPEREESMIYDAKALVKLLLDGVITAEQTEHEAHVIFRGRAEELGRLGIWRERKRFEPSTSQ